MPYNTDSETKEHTLHRFFTIFSPLPEHLPFEHTLTESIAVHHIRNVLRLKAGKQIILIDQHRESSYIAEIKKTNRENIVTQVITKAQTEAKSFSPAITLACAIIKGQRWDWMLQKATELGVREIQPIITERTTSHKESQNKKADRWHQTIRSAAEQSGGLFIPRISETLPLKVLLKREIQAGSPDTLKIILLERGPDRKTLKSILKQSSKRLTPYIKILCAIGPEGGWTTEETVQLIESGFQPASIGEHILRSETAAIAFMSALAYENTP